MYRHPTVIEARNVSQYFTGYIFFLRQYCIMASPYFRLQVGSGGYRWVEEASGRFIQSRWRFVSVCFSVCHYVLVCLSLSWSASVRLDMSRSALFFFGIPWSISVCLGQSHAVLVYFGLFWSASDCFCLSRLGSVYVSMSLHVFLPCNLSACIFHLSDSVLVCLRLSRSAHRSRSSQFKLDHDKPRHAGRAGTDLDRPRQNEADRDRQRQTGSDEVMQRHSETRYRKNTPRHSACLSVFESAFVCLRPARCEAVHSLLCQSVSLKLSPSCSVSSCLFLSMSVSICLSLADAFHFP